MECELCSSLKENKFLVYETKHWKVFLHTKDQRCLGRCVVTLRRHAGDIAELNKEELLDFAQLARDLESASKKAFRATMFNWTCLMNNAYQKKPYNPHVHWHFRSRYDHEVKFGGLTFKDELFGHHYSGDEKYIVSDDILDKITKALSEKL